MRALLLCLCQILGLTLLCSARVVPAPRRVQPPRRHLDGACAWSATLPRTFLVAYPPASSPQIPKNLRLMYVHAWQSYIWNRIVSERVKLFGAKQPVEGDLVYADGEGAEDEPVASDEDAVAADGTEAATAAPAAPAEEASETPSTAAAAANPQLAHFIATSKVRKVRALTAADIASGAFSIYDVVLPMPGFAVSYPAGELGEVYKRVIREDGIDPDNMWRKQKEYSLVRSSLLCCFGLNARLRKTHGGRLHTGRRLPQDCSPPLRRVVPSPRLDFAQRGPRSVGRGRPARSRQAQRTRVPRGGRPAQGGREPRFAG